jgi:ABC-type transport system involved in cytochrome bd biosynthesis fused ATPase/permease subunit
LKTLVVVQLQLLDELYQPLAHMGLFFRKFGIKRPVEFPVAADVYKTKRSRLPVYKTKRSRLPAADRTETDRHVQDISTFEENRSRVHEEQDPNHSQEQRLIAVMGATGVGKSTFIKSLVGGDLVRVGHDLNSGMSG